MTSISAASAQTYQSPLQKLQDELLSEVKSGAIKSSDQDALSAALIDSAMQASRASGTRPSPDGLKSKIDDLIASEVSSGKLTSDQATELQGIFKAAFANGPGGAGGPPPGGRGGPPADGASSSDDSSSSTTSTSIDDILKQFLQSLQESLSASSSTTSSTVKSPAAS